MEARARCCRGSIAEGKVAWPHGVWLGQEALHLHRRGSVSAQCCDMKSMNSSVPT